MIIRIALWLLLFALLLHSLASVLAIALLLCAFGLLLSLLVWNIAKASMQAVARYCSKTERGRRRLLFVENRQRHLKELFYNRALRIHTLHELKRQQLLRRNQQKQINALSRALEKTLKQRQKQFSTAELKQLRQHIRQYRQQQDSAALLNLQQQIVQDD